MEAIKIAILIVGSIVILFGYLRFITDEEGNIDVNNYRFTGGLGLVLGGVFEGSKDLISRNVSPNGVSALAIYSGIILFYIGFKV